MSWTKFENIKELLHPGSLSDVKKWLKNNNASLSDKELDILALESIKKSMDAHKIPNSEKALKILNAKLKLYIHEKAKS